MRMTIFRSSREASLTLAMMGALVAPIVAIAQQPTAQPTAQPAGEARSHTVREGDTLWDIARAYLGDPFLWPEIYRINTGVVEDPHWIYPGETLRLPGGGSGGGSGGGEVIAGGSGNAPAGSTVFRRAGMRTTDSLPRVQLAGRVTLPIVQPGEYWAAPFVEREGGPRGTGRVLSITEFDRVGSGDAQFRRRVSLNQTVFISPPPGTVTSVGDRYLALSPGPTIENVGQVMIPTGILIVEGGAAGDATRARAQKGFAPMYEGDLLIPLPPFALSATARPAPVQLGAEARVLWLQDEPALPTLQQYMVLSLSSRDGVQVGDQVTLLEKRRAVDAQSATLPERRIATLRVVRVTPFASTALLVDQDEAHIQEGSIGRVTAKMP